MFCRVFRSAYWLETIHPANLRPSFPVEERSPDRVRGVTRLASVQTGAWLALAAALAFALLLTGCSAATPAASPVTTAPVATAPATDGTATAAITKAPVPVPAQAHPPAATETAHPAPVAPEPCQETSGRVITDSLKTPQLSAPLNYRIYLPPCYTQNADQRYPVLYLFHGQGFNDRQWDRIGADEIANRLIVAGEIPPLLIAMPHDRSMADVSQSDFEQIFLDSFVPFIDTTYRTRPERQYRALGGLSRGSGMAIHIGIRQWQIFGAIGAHSPAIFVSDAQFLPRWLDAIPPAAAPRIYIDIGDRDLILMEQAAWFESLLDERDIPHEWRLFGGEHNEAYWRAHLEHYLRWYTQGW